MKECLKAIEIKYLPSNPSINACANCELKLENGNNVAHWKLKKQTTADGNNTFRLTCECQLTFKTTFGDGEEEIYCNETPEFTAGLEWLKANKK